MQAEDGTPRVSKRHRVARVLGIAVLSLMLILAGLVGYGRAVMRRVTHDVVSIKDLDSYQDAAQLERAWALPVAATYAQLQYQPRASWCGPTSVANVMTSLEIDPAATPASVLEGTGYCRLGECIPGLTLEELAEIARAKTQREVTVLRDLSLEQLREHLRRTNDPSKRYIVNFLRGPLFRKGGGHHSPIGGYLEDEDMVLVLDVNADYQPWLVSSERLHDAIDTIDSSTDQKRGLLLIE